MACARLIVNSCWRARVQVYAAANVRTISQLVGCGGLRQIGECESRSTGSAAYRSLHNISASCGVPKPAANPAALARHLMNVSSCLDLYYSAGSDEDC
ncbi:hypothetical protein PLESTB_001550500 [Pleodorina starrii]|uniref:Uncharacterized protein n=1 Tax=Pleodorina starrii TaxID=330485 RepID=A0A9W6BXY0_9CHLO|nr:hypothetical protein PLESTB_001550500 [Pleodorina starrii]